MAQALDNFINDGDGVLGISVNVSTAEDVTSQFGAPPKMIKHHEYSNEMKYAKLGLSFYYCQNDPNRHIFVINIKKPFEGTTSRGVVIGRSSFEEVKSLYGDPRDPDDENDSTTGVTNTAATTKTDPPSSNSADELEFDKYGIQFYLDQKSKGSAERSSTPTWIVREIDIYKRGGITQCNSEYPKLVQ